MTWLLSCFWGSRGMGLGEVMRGIYSKPTLSFINTRKWKRNNFVLSSSLNLSLHPPLKSYRRACIATKVGIPSSKLASGEFSSLLFCLSPWFFCFLLRVYYFHYCSCFSSWNKLLYCFIVLIASILCLVCHALLIFLWYAGFPYFCLDCMFVPFSKLCFLIFFVFVH